MGRQSRRRQDGFTRREFLAAGGAALAAGALGFPAIVRAGGRVDTVIVLGIDAMDPRLVRKFVADGRLPNCARLMDTGFFSPLGTSDPPQSPVAWSNFISGTNPGGHGIYDFIARDASTLIPYLATARTEPPKRALEVGKFRIPLSNPETELLRRGDTLWAVLQDHGVDCRVMRAPVNFPPTETDALTLSGLTTPDVHGSYGVFSFYTTEPGAKPRDVAGGRIIPVRNENGRVRCVLRGPTNTFLAEPEKVQIPFEVETDPERPLARIRVQDRTVVLRQGEWSDWITVRFPMIPHVVETTGICRLFLRAAQPHVELYVSPVNIDPADPAMPISTPARYARDLARAIGPFYTQGMPEDTAALSAGVFSDDDYRRQATFVLDESLRLFHHEFDRFERGFFFTYFSSLDLNQHMFWRCHDRRHPSYSRELEEKHGDFIPWLYEQMDAVIGRALERAGDRAIVMAVSDHGFVSFRRQFNLNSWLADSGFARLLNPRDRGNAGFYEETDWGRTRAYGLGINGLYLNLRGREPDGTVEPGDEAERVKDELIERLTAVRDPQTGDPVLSGVYRPSELYSGPETAGAPDLVVGYNENYRASWDTVLGSYPREHVLDNTDPWSGDHCMDSRFLPGVVLSSRRLGGDSPNLTDLAPTILAALGAPVPRGMTGRNLLKEG